MGPDVISSRANARVKQLRAAFQGHARLSGGMVAIEGDHLLEEALRSGMVLKTVFVSERREVPKIVPRGVEVMRLTEEVFGSVVETQSPQGVAALMVPPVWVLEDVMGGRCDCADFDCGGVAGSGESGDAGAVGGGVWGDGGVDDAGDGECVEPEGAAG